MYKAYTLDNEQKDKTKKCFQRTSTQVRDADRNNNLSYAGKEAYSIRRIYTDWELLATADGNNLKLRHWKLYFYVGL